MRWPTVPLKEIAPAQTPNIRFSPDEPVWHLTLDQVESHTGNIVNKKIAPASAAGTSTNVFDDGNVLYSKLRPYLNKVICPTEPGIATTELVPLRPRKDLLDRRYLTYYLRSNHFLGFANVAVAGVKMPRIIMTKFWKHRIPLPPLFEQHRIVEILDQADALRKKRADADAKAARILPALFYKMFGDPATNPKGWPIAPIDEMVAPIERRDPTGQPDDPFTYIDIAGVDGQLGVISIAKTLIGAEAPSRARQVIKTNDVIVSTVRPYLRATALVPAEYNNQICSTGFCVLRAKSGVGFGFLYALSRLKWFTDQLNTLARGASYPAVTDSDVFNLRVPQPIAQGLLKSFDRQVLDVLALQDKRRGIAARIESLFETLLHRAFTGDLTAKWREAHMKELLAEMEAQAKALDCPSTQSKSPEIRSKRHAGHDMYNKAALAAYITDRCHAPDRPMGRVKLAKLFYLVQQKAEIELTETFMKRAAGPLDDEIHKFLSLAQKSKWIVLCRGEGDLKPIKPGATVSKAVEQAQKLLGPAKAKVDEMLDQMKGWGYRTLERWATVLDATFELTAAGQPATVEGVKDIIQRHPDWEPKLSRDEFSDTNIEATLKGLRDFGFITNQD
ncbi:restriction endonuclease subunit S [Anaerohalosphaeraceae bacterium U12dextr]